MALIIGSHVQVAGDGMLVDAVRDSIEYGANTFMIYTGAPQNTFRKSISRFRLDEAKELMQSNGIDMNNVIVHAPYIINLANTTNENTMELAISFLRNEISRVQEIGCHLLVIHPGSHVGAGIQIGMDKIVSVLNEVLDNDDSNVIILLETMSGKGTEIGSDFEELGYIISRVHKINRVGICMDTCHMNDAGYDMENFDKVLDTFDSAVGLSKLKAIHINDSKNARGSHKDRHANIGSGYIGFDNLINIIYNPRLNGLPMILETPFIGDNAPYKEEIRMIKTKAFNTSFLHNDISK